MYTNVKTDERTELEFHFEHAQTPIKIGMSRLVHPFLMILQSQTHRSILGSTKNILKAIEVTFCCLEVWLQ